MTASYPSAELMAYTMRLSLIFRLFSLKHSARTSNFWVQNIFLSII